MLLPVSFAINLLYHEQTLLIMKNKCANECVYFTGQSTDYAYGGVYGAGPSRQQGTWDQRAAFPNPQVKCSTREFTKVLASLYSLVYLLNNSL